jgi:dTMP kinase
MIKNQYDGLFISVEGIDGSGTTTLCEGLKRELPDENWEFTAEPSNGKYGRVTREELKSDSPPTMSDFFLFCADRFDHLQSLIGPKLESGQNVVTDRYTLSTYAYQSPVVRKDIVSQSGLEYINTILSEWVIRPDVTIFLDIPVEEAMDRMTDGTEKYEKEEKLETAYEIYDSFANNRDHIVRIDATQSEEEVLSEAMGHINEIRI